MAKFPMKKQLMHVMMNGVEQFLINNVDGVHKIVDKFSEPLRGDGKILTTAGLLPLTTVVTVIRRDNMPPPKPSTALTEAIDKLITAVEALTRRIGESNDFKEGYSARMASNTVSFSVGDTGFTRSGHAYRIICTDCGGDWPVIALIKHDDPLHGEVADKYTSLGHWVDDDDESPNDLSPPSPGFLPGF